MSTNDEPKPTDPLRPADSSASPETVVIVDEGEVLEESAGGSLEPYLWNRATIQVHITIHPEDGDEAGRLVSVAAWTHRDAPVADAVRRRDLGALPPVVVTALRALQEQLPERERLAGARRSLRAQAAINDEKKRTAARSASVRAKPAEKKGAAATAKHPPPAPDAPACAAPEATGTAQTTLFENGGRRERDEHHPAAD